MNTYGIENLKKLLSFIVLGLGKAINIDKNNNGKVSFTEILSMVTTLSFKFPGVYESFPFLKKEFGDLSTEEIGALVTFVNELDIEVSDNVEEVLKRTINMLHYNYRYVLFIKDAVA